MFQYRKIVFPVVMALGAALLLSGCGANVGSMTCQEFIDTPSADRLTVERKLLSENDLRVLDTENLIGLTSALISFCEDPKNGERPIDDAVDWSTNTW